MGVNFVVVDSDGAAIDVAAQLCPLRDRLSEKKMAYADYQLCQVCGGKAFYDANLNYERCADADKSLHPIEGSQSEYDLSGQKLDSCAQIAAVCVDCYRKGWRLIIAGTVRPA